MDSVNKTLYIPLYGKSYVSRRGLFLRDEAAQRIWQAEGFDLHGKAASKWLAYNMGMRAAVFDRWVTQAMAQKPGSVVLHLGCGLDSRSSRVDTRGCRWYDVDFPQVIAERQKYFTEDDTVKMIGADLREEGWLDAVPDGADAIVVMEGVSMYLTNGELKDLMKALKDRFSRVKILMDTYTTFAVKATRYKNPINQVGVTQVYGFDDPYCLTEDTCFVLKGEYSLTPQDMIDQLKGWERGFFRCLFAGKTAKKIYRLYEYQTDFYKMTEIN